MYPPELTRQAAKILRGMGTPCLIHQPNYSLFDRWVEDGLLDVLTEEGIGCIVFSPLDQGVLTNRYLKGIPSDSRAGKPDTYFSHEDISEDKLGKVRRLNAMAKIAPEHGTDGARWLCASLRLLVEWKGRVSQVEDAWRP
jgi:L-glyceraldehyde 3-phosphate reductase